MAQRKRRSVNLAIPAQCQNKHDRQGSPKDQVKKGMLERKKNPLPTENTGKVTTDQKTVLSNALILQRATEQPLGQMPHKDPGARSGQYRIMSSGRIFQAPSKTIALRPGRDTSKHRLRQIAFCPARRARRVAGRNGFEIRGACLNRRETARNTIQIHAVWCWVRRYAGRNHILGCMQI
jgi:hypothetical protein